ncbi:PTS transporter subunit EIIC [Oceanobacillus sp. FSL W7-1304]|uniref:PTS transporter subunit EIIC n=1 Tax=Oceanobacillus TaxID=182709 RepID=UPI0030D93E4A
MSESLEEANETITIIQQIVEEPDEMDGRVQDGSTGLHHFMWQPFVYVPAAVNEGLLTNWFTNLGNIAASSESMTTLFPRAGFMMYGNTKVFGSLGIAIAIILASKPEKRKKTIGLIVPVALTAVLTGITEPLEFTFLFIALFLFSSCGTWRAYGSYSFYEIGNKVDSFSLGYLKVY